MHMIISFVSLLLWKSARETEGANLFKIFIMTMVMRMLGGAIVFAGGVYVIREDIEAIKLFAIIFAAFYFIVLVADTVYFCLSCKESNEQQTEKE